MNKYIAGLVGAAAMVAVAPAAHAGSQTFVPGDPQFKITVGDPTNPASTVTAVIGDTITTVGNFTDTFQFTILGNGLGSGTLSTSASLFNNPTNLDFTSIFVNGTQVAIDKTMNGLIETSSIAGFAIKAGVQNTITVNGYSRGNGSYGGNATFTPTSVPETATWAMMILGFGVVGAAMRRRRTSPKGYRLASTKVSFA